MKYFLIVASKDHVQLGLDNGFCQSGHGKKIQLEKLKKDDWVIYYSPKDKVKEGKSYQKFTAIGQVEDEEPYQITVNSNFKPWRRKINYYPANELEIKPLLDNLNFITNKKRWGLHLRSGFLELEQADFEKIRNKMLIDKGS